MPLTGLISKYTAWRRSVYRRKVRDSWKMLKALNIRAIGFDYYSAWKPDPQALKGIFMEVEDFMEVEEDSSGFDHSAWKSDPQPLKDIFKQEKD